MALFERSGSVQKANKPVLANAIYKLSNVPSSQRVSSVRHVIRWHSISMRAGPAFLQFDWSKAGLSMDLPVFVYSHTKTSFRLLSRQRKYRREYREAFYVVTDLLLQATQREPYRALVLSRLRLSRSTDHQDRNLHSLSHRFQSSCG